jgi:glutamyl-tRNA reductase
MNEGIISGVSVSHERATVDEIETVATADTGDAVDALLDHPAVEEAFVLQTCNRAEAYVVTAEAATGRAALAEYVAPVAGGTVRELDHEEAIRHLMRVASGLESLVVGEDQIIGQVRDAVATARAAGGVGATLEPALLKALHVGERARDETAINEGIVSLGSAAADLAASESATPLAEATALVVGAGEMGTLAAEALAPEADRVVVANRTRRAAEHVAEALDADAAAVGLSRLPAVASEASVVVTATGAGEPVLGREALADAGETVVVDIAQPRDLSTEAAALANVTAHDLDDLESVTERTLAAREEAAREVEAMIDAGIDELLTQYKRKRADEVIAAMYEGAERMKAEEVEEALSRLEAAGDVSDEQREVIESMADALVSGILAAPTRSLRDAAENDDWTTISTALRLFDPSSAGAGGEIPPGADADAEEMPEAIRGGMPAAVLDQLGDE